MFRTSLRLAAGAAAVAAGLGVSGCGPVQMGAAATVGDQRITTAQLEQTVARTVTAAENHQLRVLDRASLQRGELSRKIHTKLLDLAADRAGITVSAGAVDRAIAQQGNRSQFELQLLQQYAVPPQEVRGDVRDRLIEQRLAEQLAPGAGPSEQQTKVVDFLRGVARDAGVKVSPRYGRFSTEQLAVVQKKDTLSKPDTQGIAPNGAPGQGPAGASGQNP